MNYQVRQKKKSHGVFSATYWSFSVNFFYKFMSLSYLHLHLPATQRLVVFKYDEVIHILAWPLSDIRSLKKTFAPKRSKTTSLKQHGEHFFW